MATEYQKFLKNKSQIDLYEGFKPIWMPEFLFDFQAFVTDWHIRKGSSAGFLDCGMGKTPIALTWAENIVRKTNKPVLNVTPLGVTAQTIREGAKFGIDCRRSGDGAIPHKGIVVTNYERLSRFNPNDFAGCVCDESSILKSFDGVRKQEITEFMRKMRYRLLCTATAAPNDYIELGTSSETLGYLGHMDMLNRFFKNDSNNSATGRSYGEVVKWRFKGHAEEIYWKWVCSWARSARRPSDLGFADGPFVLPPLTETVHVVETATLADGMLFAMPATDIREQREERRRTITERSERVAELCAPYDQNLIWCHLNEEGDTLARMIPDSIQISGKDSDERKEEVFLAFASGKIRDLITKPKIGAWGLNFQTCQHVVGFPSHSYEQYYQGVRRCWRFGQKRPVVSDLVTTEGERAVIENQQRKSLQAETMFTQIVANMGEAMHIDKAHSFKQKEEIPTWL